MRTKIRFNITSLYITYTKFIKKSENTKAEYKKCFLPSRGVRFRYIQEKVSISLRRVIKPMPTSNIFQF